MRIRSKKTVYFTAFLTLIFALTGLSAAPARAENAVEMPYGGGYAATGQITDAGITAKLYDATNGLPTSDANYILCSSDGYLWIGSFS